MSIQLQHGEERFLWHLNVSDLLHTFLASLLFLQQFALTAHVAAVALGKHVFAHLLHRLAGNDLCTDSSLDSYIELLARQQLLEFLAHAATKIHSIVAVRERGQRVHLFAVLSLS